MLRLVFPKVLFSVLFFSASTPPLLLLLLPLSLFLSSNLLMTHNITFLFPHPISSVKSIVLKIVSLPGTVITPFPSIPINLTLFFLEPGKALILSRTSPRSTSRAWFFQWQATSGYSVSHSTIACRWSSTWTKSVTHTFTTYVHCDIFDQPSPSAMQTSLPTHLVPP